MKGNLRALAPAVDANCAKCSKFAPPVAGRRSFARERAALPLALGKLTDAVSWWTPRALIQSPIPRWGDFRIQIQRLTGQNFSLLLAEGVRGTFASGCRAILQSDSGTNAAAAAETGRRKEGGEIFAEIGFTNTNSGEQIPVAFIRDITERKRAEEESACCRVFRWRSTRRRTRLGAGAGVAHDLRGDRLGAGQAWLPSSDATHLECSPAWYTTINGSDQFRAVSED